MMFENKENAVEDLFSGQFKILDEIGREFLRFVSDYLNEPDNMKEQEYHVNELEHEGDGIRRDIETKIEKGAFLPILREDYIMLAEMIDSIINRIQSTYMELILTRPAVPKDLYEDILKLAGISLCAGSWLEKIFPLIEEPIEKTKKSFKEIERQEHEADIVEQELIRKIFAMEIEYAHKLHLREIVERLASFSDLAEDVGDRMQIMVVKRTI